MQILSFKYGEVLNTTWAIFLNFAPEEYRQVLFFEYLIV